MTWIHRLFVRHTDAFIWAARISYVTYILAVLVLIWAF